MYPSGSHLSELPAMRKMTAPSHSGYCRRSEYQDRESAYILSSQTPTSRPSDSSSSSPSGPEPVHPGLSRSLPASQNWQNRTEASCLICSLRFHRFQESMHTGIRGRRYNPYVPRSDSHGPAQNKNGSPLRLCTVLEIAELISPSYLCPPFFPRQFS